MTDHSHCAKPEQPAAPADIPQKKTSKLAAIFKKCAACTGPGAGAFAAAHAGCVLKAGLIAGGVAATGGLSVLSFAFTAAVTAGGLYAWHRMRGQKAGKTEKTIMFGSAVSGLALSAAMLFTSAEKPEDAPCPMHRGMTMQQMKNQNQPPKH